MKRSLLSLILASALAACISPKDDKVNSENIRDSNDGMEDGSAIGSSDEREEDCIKLVSGENRLTESALICKGNYIGSTIIIENDGITLAGNNSTLIAEGDQEYGIFSEDNSNITIRDFRLNGYKTGVQVISHGDGNNLITDTDFLSGIILEDLIVEGKGADQSESIDAILLFLYKDSRIIGCITSKSYSGIRAETNNTEITKNKVEGHYLGIVVNGNGNRTFENTARNNHVGIRVLESSDWNSHNVTGNNTYEGNDTDQDEGPF